MDLPLPTSPLGPGQAAARLPLEIALAHSLVMTTAATVERLLDCGRQAPTADAGLDSDLAAGSLAGLTARLMGGVRRGSAALIRLRVQGVVPAVEFQPAQAPTAAPAAPKYHAAPGQARGRLANGNPSGDYLAAPRCGARTRAGCACRQPAMTNGRCRFHGGKSTGPRTAAGLARSRAARLVHGGRTRAVIGLRSRAVHSARRLRALIRAAAPRPAGHGVDRPDSARKIHHRVHRGRRGSNSTPARPARNQSSSVPSVSSLVNPVSAGLGLHRSDSTSPAPSTGRRARLLAEGCRLAASSAGPGLHRLLYA